MKHVQATNNAKRIGKILHLGLDTNSKRAAQEWMRGIILVMEETERGGRRYYYPGLGWTRASLPGRPPAIQTRTYANSFQVRRVGRGPRWAVGTPMQRGDWLERGTENMAPRPHFYEGYRRNRAAITRALSREITARERHFGVG